MKNAQILKGIIVAFACILAGAAFFGMLYSDNPISYLAPENLLQIAMPSLVGVKSDEMDYDADHSEHIESEDENAELIKFELLEAGPSVPENIMIELLGTKGKGIDLSGDKPKVLIYHTHTKEAYTPTKANPYVATDKWRTDDDDKNIVRIGEELTKQLSEKYGISVIHDTTDHESPSLRTAYTRSLETMEKYLKKYPSIQLFIDVHRDAYESDGKRDFALVNGVQAARLMFVVGTGEGKTGAGFSKKPNYKENYALARAVTEKLQKVNSQLVRPIRVKTNRYNQHIPGRALLVEVGHNENTLEEALNSVPYLAQAIAQSTELTPETVNTPKPSP